MLMNGGFLSCQFLFVNMDPLKHSWCTYCDFLLWTWILIVNMNYYCEYGKYKWPQCQQTTPPSLPMTWRSIKHFADTAIYSALAVNLPHRLHGPHITWSYKDLLYLHRETTVISKRNYSPPPPGPPSLYADTQLVKCTRIFNFS